jgi:hypothetical protein
MDVDKRTEIGSRSSFEDAAILFDPHDADAARCLVDQVEDDPPAIRGSESYSRFRTVAANRPASVPAA